MPWFIKYFLIILIGVGLGYYWAFQAYLPAIKSANQRLSVCSQMLNLKKSNYQPVEINIK